MIVMSYRSPWENRGTERVAGDQAVVRQMLREVLVGREDPECFFAMCLSVLGNQETRSEFLSIIKPLSTANIRLHSVLRSLYQDYFTKTEDDELEIALALSLLEMKENQMSAPNQLVLQAGNDQSSLPLSSKPTSQEKSFSKQEDVPGREKSEFTEQSRSKTKETFLDIENDKSLSFKSGDNQSLGSSQPPYIPGSSASFTIPTTASKSDQMIRGDGNVSEKPKRPKSRRQRRKAAAQQVVGLIRSPSAPPPVLLWFRRDLRLCDNPALIGSLEVGAPVIPIFIWSPEEEEGPGVTVAMGGACKYWLHQALSCFRASLEQIGSHLVFFKASNDVTEVGSSLNTLKTLVKETGAQSVMANALYEPWLKERDDAVSSALQKEGVEFKMFHSYCLRDPFSVSTEGVGLRGIGSVSHFMSCCRQNPGAAVGVPLDPPVSLPSPAHWPQGVPLDALGLARMPRRKDGTIVDWAANIRKSWDFSEDGAHARLEAFLHDGVYRYEKESGRADAPNTSSLSPYLHFGQLSPRWLLWDAKGARCRPPKFQRKLAWRDLAYWQLTLFPDLPWESLRPPYKALRWNTDRSHLKAWQKGNTGYPLVDAAMRQLWLTGWMNNYMRHVVASFLIAYLHLPWQEGYRWFQDTLVDADVAIDAMMWQNGGMCGLDHWNFVMHPVDAAMTCDPYGSYVRKWCPELSDLPDELIHKPWKCPASMLRRAGVVFGQTYPERIVIDLEERRTKSLQDVALVRKQFQQYVDKRSGCDLVPLPKRLVSEALGLSHRDGAVVTEGKQFLLPVITRMEFKHQLEDPDADAASNPYNAVLKGYVSRKRDETIAFLNERDFTASVMYEGAQRRERLERDHRRLEGLPPPPSARGKARRTPTAKDRFSVVPGGAIVSKN
ncbi:PREDICTED: deoxyribodipyrimidine photo-lyase-like isoform X2 [Cyprinodon variegatus]|uniref:deoxyribodipyrimidine photo-lyase-like isoform X2 n=1 Tax=Cyprinodon variegatus TaxID=28743 RepID=UPI000742C2C7|nr:PREDICTED: deoxyribodipyrimidine photo-lyase-like isoform X2 [Cyprinodon variegatus]